MQPSQLSQAKPQPLSSQGHALYELAGGLLLVFKPRGHREATHAHPYGQRLRVIRGQLRVEIGDASVFIDPESDGFVVGSGRLHGTEALEDTWLIAERIS